MFVEILHQVHK